jgi:hypothetical protein
MTNEKELKLIQQITEIGLHLAEVKAENKILKDFNETLKQALRMHDDVGRSELLKAFNCVNFEDGHEICETQCDYCKRVKGF